MIQTAFVAIGRLDREHAAVYCQVIWKVLAAPMRRALEARVMEQQTKGETKFPPFMQEVFERAFQEGEIKGKREGEIKGKRDALLGLLARAQITLTEGDRARVQACDDAATLDRWVGNVIGAKTAADVLS